MVNAILYITIHKSIQVVYSIINSMVSDSSLRIVVCTYLRIVLPRLGTLDLDVGVRALRPLGDVRPLGEETGLAGEDADFVERNVGGKRSGLLLEQGNVRPRPCERRLALLGLVDDLASADARMADVRAECRTALAGRVELQRHGQNVAAPLDLEGFG